MWFLPKYSLFFRNELLHIYFFVPKSLDSVDLLSSVHYAADYLIGDCPLPIRIFLELEKGFSVELLAFYCNLSHYVKSSFAEDDIRKGNITFTGNIEIAILLKLYDSLGLGYQFDAISSEGEFGFRVVEDLEIVGASVKSWYWRMMAYLFSEELKSSSLIYELIALP